MGGETLYPVNSSNGTRVWNYRGPEPHSDEEIERAGDRFKTKKRPAGMASLSKYLGPISNRVCRLSGGSRNMRAISARFQERGFQAKK